MKSLEEIEKEMQYGDIFTINDFIDCVKDGMFIDYDGHGYFHDGENKTKESVECNVEFLKSFVEKYPYVCWYNK